MAKKLSDDELRAITDSEMRMAVGYFSGKLANMRQKSMSYYLGEAKGDLAPPEVDGRSSVVVPVVRNTIESMLPQLMVKFSGSEHVVEFTPNKPGDEKGAEQATDYINYLFYAKNNGEKIVYDWMKDALLSKNGIVKVWWDTRNEESREEYRAMSDIELAQLSDDEEIEITEQKIYPDEEDAEQRQKALEQISQQYAQASQAAMQGDQQAAQAAQQMQQQAAQIQAQPPKMLYDVVCKRVKKGGRVCVENVPPEEFLIARNAKSIEDARFVGHRVMRTQSELKSMGYDNVDNISGDDQATSMNMERIERLAWDDEQAYVTSDQVNTADESQRVIWVTECYLRVDADGDGIAELRKIVRAGNQILDNEIVDAAPFVSITPVPMPHKFFGLSVADLAMEGQKTETSLLRSSLDNQYLNVNGRTFAVEGQVNLDDLLTSRPGGVVRIKQQGAVGMLDQGRGDVQSSMAMMEYMKGFNEDSTGWTRYNQGSDGDTLNDTATGINIVTNRADMRLDLIARNFAEGFRDLFRLMLKMVSQYQSKEDVINLRGTWVPIDPREWKNGFGIAINVGLGTGNKDQTIKQLMLLLANQEKGMQIGITTPKNIYNSGVELIKAMGFKSADKYLTDPGNAPMPKPPDPTQGQMQIEQMKAQLKAQTDTQAKQAEIELERERMQMQAQVDTHRQQVEAQQKAMEMQQQKELEQIKLEASMQLEQFKAQMQHSLQVELAKINAETQLLTAQVKAQALVTKQQDDAADSALNDEQGE